MKKQYYNSTTIVVIGYKSRDKILKFISKIPKNIKTIIVDNSKDYKLKKIVNKKTNIKIYLTNIFNTIQQHYDNNVILDFSHNFSDVSQTEFC